MAESKDIEGGSVVTIVTAISDPDFEAMVAGTLYSHGWSVLFRALDVNSLEKFLLTNAEAKPVLIYSNDLPGLDVTTLTRLSPQLDRAIGFLSGNQMESQDGFLARPHDGIELLAMIRSPHRAPMLRTTRVDHLHSRCTMLALAGSNHGDGVTTTVLNLAIELTLTGKKVLLIDAHNYMPAIATIMGERHANQEMPREISPTLQIFEITRENAPNAIEVINQASMSVDFILIDLGLITYSDNSSFNRRWESIFSTWVLAAADDLWIFSSPGLVSLRALREFIVARPHITIRGRVTHLLTQRIPGKKGDTQEEKFLAITSPSAPHALRILPLDIRGVSAASADRSILIESNSRGLLRKSIAGLALELTQ